MLQLLSIPFMLFTAYRITNWIRNYIAARKYDIPIILIPVAFDDVWWLPLRPLFRWVERLPFGLGSWYLYTEMGWPTVDGRRTCIRLGENFILCSPKSIQIVTCYQPTVEKVYRQHKQWPMPAEQAKLFTVYGENVSSAHGADWQRHHKITSSAFNEQTMARVWEESKARTIAVDVGNGTQDLNGVRSLFNLLAMHVLGAVAFGQDSPLTEIGPGHRQSLMECLNFILKNVILTLVFHGVKAPDWMLPQILRRLKVAVAEFGLYMKESVLREMQSEKSISGQRSLLSAMVQANEAEKHGIAKSEGRPSYLTESELYGNLFVFNLAGFETTASTMTFALSYLALHPGIQQWLREENDTKYRHSSSYSETYPKLVRCQAWMYETLRLAGPAPLLVRSPAKPETLEIMTRHGPQTMMIEPGTLVGANQNGGHLSPKWGENALEFDPRRFVAKNDAGEETLTVPEGVMYMPWVFGSRVCPGKKFSQVEFVAIVAQLLTDFDLQLDAKVGESEARARDRMRSVLDEKYNNISAYVRRPEDAGIRLSRRAAKS